MASILSFGHAQRLVFDSDSADFVSVISGLGFMFFNMQVLDQFLFVRAQQISSLVGRYFASRVHALEGLWGYIGVVNVHSDIVLEFKILGSLAVRPVW